MYISKAILALAFVALVSTYYDSGDASDATPISFGKKEIRVVMSIVYELR